MNEKSKNAIYAIATFLSIFSFLNYLSLEFGFGGLGKEMAVAAI